eukprot:5908431-Pyramimonas_sp.AAC.1
MRGLLPPTPSGTPPGGFPRGARLVRSPGEAGQRQGRTLLILMSTVVGLLYGGGSVRTFRSSRAEPRTDSAQMSCRI